MKQHYSQTRCVGGNTRKWFESPMKQHYSQTICGSRLNDGVFESPMKQHYSQTLLFCNAARSEFESPMKQHYSQTSNVYHNIHKQHYATVKFKAMSQRESDFLKHCITPNRAIQDISHKSESMTTLFSMDSIGYAWASIAITEYPCETTVCANLSISSSAT